MFENQFDPQSQQGDFPPAQQLGDDSPPLDFSKIDASPDDKLDFSSITPAPFSGLPLSVTDNRAAKAHFAMGDNSPGVEMLKGAFATSGGEWNTRQQMAANEDVANRQNSLDMLRRITFANPEITPTDVDAAVNIANVKPVDPETVLEKNFAKSFMQFGATVRPDINNVFSKGWMQAPGATAFQQYIGTSITTRKSLVQSLEEEADTRWKGTPWFAPNTDGRSVYPTLQAQGAADAYFLSTLPGMSWYNMHDAIMKVPGLFPGTNMANQIRALWNIPDDDQFNKALRASFEATWARNPLDAIALVKAAKSFSDSDELLGNVNGYVDIGSVLPVGTILKGGKAVAGLFDKESVVKTAAGKYITSADIEKSPAFAGYTPSKTVPTEVPVKPDTFEPVQLDLFKGDPRQGNLFPEPTQTAPDIAAGLPPGKLRSTYKPLSQQDAEAAAAAEQPFRNPLTGRMEKPISRQQQLELPMEKSSQLTLFERLAGEGTKDAAEKTATVQQVSQAVGDIVKASGNVAGKVDPEIVFNKLGDIESASRVGVNRVDKLLYELNETGRVASQTADLKGLEEFGKDLPSSLNPVGLDKNPTGFGRARNLLLVDRLASEGVSFRAMLSKTNNVETRPPEVLEAAFKDTANDLKHEFHTNEDHIVDTMTAQSYDPTTNTRTAHVFFGDRGKLPFTKMEHAETFAKDILGIDPERYQVTPAQQGIGFYVRVSKPVDLFGDAARNLTLTTKYASVPPNRIGNMLFRTFNPQTAEDLLSEFDRAARKVATHSPMNFRAFFKDIIDENILNISQKDRREVQDVLRANRDYQDKGKRGIFAETPGEFEDMFREMKGKGPTPEQTNAYFSLIQLNNYDWVIRNLSVLRDKQIRGIEEHRWVIGDGKSPYIEGKTLQKFPTDINEDSGIMMFRGGKFDYFRRHGVEWESRYREMREALDSGYQLVQVADPAKRPLMNLTGEKDIVNYILTNTKETRPLPWKQMEYQEGGHVIYSHPWWVKQARIATSRDGNPFYFGDFNLLNMSTKAEADMWAPRYNEAFRIYNQGNDAAFDTYVTKNLPHTTQDLKEMIRNGVLDPSMPFHSVSSDKNAVSANREYFHNKYLDKGGLRNDVDSQHNLYQGMDRTFLADRDYQLGTPTNTGDVVKPWKLDRAPLVEPFNAVNQALGQVLRSRFMEDYKVAAADGWVRQFGHMLQGGEREAFRRNPLAALYNAKVRSDVSDATVGVMAENARARIIDFIGQKTEWDRSLNTIQNWVANKAYDVGGKSAGDWVTDKILPWISDPAEYARAIAYNVHMSMFNPVQLWQQAQTMANSIAIAGPVNGSLGAVTSWASHYLIHTENPAIVKRFANIVETTTLGKVKSEWFEEMYDAMRRSGVEHVGAETAYRDSVMDPKLFVGTAGQWLDKSAVFFNYGERQARLTSFNTAYLEWRLANKDAELTNKIAGDILNRADTLSGNMTRASNANWQKGITSAPLQFTAYATRMMEQLTLSSRLTWREKAQAMLTYSALYGIPVTAGVPLGMDFYADIKQYAEAKGIDMSNEFVKSMTEGVIGQMSSFITGRDSDIAKKSAPAGPTIQQIVADTWNGKKSLDEALLGAGWKTIKDIYKSTAPFTAWVKDPANFPVMMEDWAGLAANSSSTWSNAMKAGYGLATGTYVTKNDVKVTDMTPMDSVMTFLLGTKPMAAEVAFEKKEAIKQQEQARDQFAQLALTAYRRAQDRYNKFNDFEGGNALMTQVHQYIKAGGFNPQQEIQFWLRASQGEMGTMEQKINEDWLKKAPPDLFKNRLEQSTGSKK